jgi:hypothetical protein
MIINLKNYYLTILNGRKIEIQRGEIFTVWVTRGKFKEIFQT